MGGACISFLFSMVWNIWVLHFWRGFSAFVKGVAFVLRFMKLHQLGEHYGDFCVGFHFFYLGSRTGNLFIDMGAHPT